MSAGFPYTAMVMELPNWVSKSYIERNNDRIFSECDTCYGANRWGQIL